MNCLLNVCPLAPLWGATAEVTKITKLPSVGRVVLVFIINWLARYK